MKYMKYFESNNFDELIKILTNFRNSDMDYDELKTLLLKHKDLLNVGKFYKPITIAISLSDTKMLQLLIEFGANINLPISHKNETPIYNAIKTDNIEIIRMLIEAGADVNIGIMNINQPPLILAFNRYINSSRDKKILDIIHELIKAGADWSLKDSTNANRNHNDFIYYTDFYNMTDYFIKRYPDQYNRYLMNKKVKIYNI